jgi:DNA-binding HxlR family transcriptional regulator
MQCILLLKSSAFLDNVMSLNNKSRFLFGKGVIEVILHLGTVEEAGYYKLYKKGFVISRETFANMLKELEKKDIIGRRVIESRPPRVEYSLTKKGKEIAEILKRLNENLT